MASHTFSYTDCQEGDVSRDCVDSQAPRTSKRCTIRRHVGAISVGVAVILALGFATGLLIWISTLQFILHDSITKLQLQIADSADAAVQRATQTVMQDLTSGFVCLDLVGLAQEQEKTNKDAISPVRHLLVGGVPMAVRISVVLRNGSPQVGVHTGGSADLPVQFPWPLLRMVYVEIVLNNGKTYLNWNYPTKEGNNYNGNFDDPKKNPNKFHLKYYNLKDIRYSSAVVNGTICLQLKLSPM